MSKLEFLTRIVCIIASGIWFYWFVMYMLGDFQPNREMIGTALMFTSWFFFAVTRMKR